MPMTLGHTAAGPGNASVRVLLVEDATLVRARLKNMLEQIQGVEIVGYADDVVEAEETFTRLHPNVVILDLELPTGSGITVLQYIRRVSRETLWSSSSRTMLIRIIAKNAYSKAPTTSSIRAPSLKW